jgi:hypothetical protein
MNIIFLEDTTNYKLNSVKLVKISPSISFFIFKISVWKTHQKYVIMLTADTHTHTHTHTLTHTHTYSLTLSLTHTHTHTYQV